MVADHWFRQVKKVLEVMKITSDAVKIRLVAFQLEGESQVWWDWIKALNKLEAMRQGAMIVPEYVAKFTELACFRDYYAPQTWLR